MKRRSRDRSPGAGDRYDWESQLGIEPSTLAATATHPADFAYTLGSKPDGTYVVLANRDGVFEAFPHDGKTDYRRSADVRGVLTVKDGMVSPPKSYFHGDPDEVTVPFSVRTVDDFLGWAAKQLKASPSERSLIIGIEPQSKRVVAKWGDHERMKYDEVRSLMLNLEELKVMQRRADGGQRAIASDKLLPSVAPRRSGLRADW